mmetsp:Transcript_26137/g.44552  ORF Transcript_26137/g.44552 Transcript_26137/m.44552 type:complete len:166 (-) Transcript_26137:92-589(-)|eukprot:CAMPEP_0183730110 /NCGR_PEP_ID=MMETSP0737-20130205/32014_1 /TAXON_ID=385413 /ORGANISM="Thalassiosira miniscula, Strain CCMP1093" /LENGTH=165 /DNA_ID=CAMNT_0025962509 /DNA_START=206 /DNA_END=703 /DNA_ORIENTATION=+
MKPEQPDSKRGLLKGCLHNSEPAIGKRVRFSNSFATTCLYQEDRFYGASKSFSAAEQKTFDENAIKEAARIKMLLLSRSEKSASKKGLFKSCGVSRKELLGIDHLILETPSHVAKRRQAHLRAVLSEQATQKDNGYRDDDRLARQSRQLTKSSASRARGRATMAT